MAIFMKYGNTQGDATQVDYEGWINIDEFTWQIDWSITHRATIKHNTRDGKHPTVQDITIRKTTDSSSKGLMDAICQPQNPNGEDCVIRFLLTSFLEQKNHDAERQPFLEYKLTNTLVTSVTVHADGTNPRPTETIKLNFTAVEMRVWSLDESNTRLAPQRFGPYSKIEG